MRAIPGVKVKVIDGESMAGRPNRSNGPSAPSAGRLTLSAGDELTPAAAVDGRPVKTECRIGRYIYNSVLFRANR
jgi:hypothetical protein